MASSTLFSIAIALLAVPLASAAPAAESSHGCKVMPSDKKWPSPKVWNAFNASVDGRLIKTIPIATPCHDPSFSKDECAEVQDNWGIADYQYVTSALSGIDNGANVRASSTQ